MLDIDPDVRRAETPPGSFYSDPSVFRAVVARADEVAAPRSCVPFVLLPDAAARFDAATSRDYEIAASWALYVDNYLEGFHVPFVHAGLNESRTQIEIAKDGEPAFELPAGHPELRKRVAAFYFWLWPTTMINAYPWGLSINVVQPLAVDRTRVRFWSFVWDPALRERGAGAGLHEVEPRGASLHHFHRLLATALS